MQGIKEERRPARNAERRWQIGIGGGRDGHHPRTVHHLPDGTLPSTPLT